MLLAVSTEELAAKLLFLLRQCGTEVLSKLKQVMRYASWLAAEKQRSMGRRLFCNAMTISKKALKRWS